MNALLNIVKTITTEDDANKVADPLRIMLLLSFLALIGLQIYDIVLLHHIFNAMTFGTGAGGLIGGSGAGLWASSKQA